MCKYINIIIKIAWLKQNLLVLNKNRIKHKLIFKVLHQHFLPGDFSISVEVFAIFVSDFFGISHVVSFGEAYSCISFPLTLQSPGITSQVSKSSPLKLPLNV